MNTIPLIFNERQIKKTVVGGSEYTQIEKRIPVSVLLLNRGARHYRSQMFQHLLRYGFESIVSIELSGDNYDIENQAKVFPSVKFIIPQENLTVGDMINVGMSEVESPHVLVLWNDTKIEHTVLSAKMFEVLAQEKLCAAPLFLNQKGMQLPVKMVPYTQKGLIKVKPAGFADSEKTLYPYDFVGIYNRQKFIGLGGFDYTIKSTYWQKLDFFIRAWLWGEEITLTSSLRIGTEEEIPEEDITPNESYFRFYLKNVLPQFKLDHAEIPKSKLFSLIGRSPYGIFSLLRTFKNARRWVFTNTYRFKYDIKYLLEMWGKENI